MIEDTIQHMQYTTYFKLNMTRNRYSCSSRFFFIDTTLTNAVCALIYTTEQFKVFRCTGLIVWCISHYVVIGSLYYINFYVFQTNYTGHCIIYIKCTKAYQDTMQRMLYFGHEFWVRNRVAHNRRVYRCLFLSHI